jgi:citrate synthase
MAGKNFGKGLEGVTVADTKISFVAGMKGHLYYRGYDIKDIAGNCSFEEAAYLIVNGSLPTRKKLVAFSAELKRERALPDGTVALMKKLNKKTTPMEALRTIVSALGSDEPDPRDVDAHMKLKTGLSIAAKFATIAAYSYRIRHGMKPVPPNLKLDHAANFLYMLSGKIPDEISSKAMDTDFLLHIDHGFNASTFSARVTVSTLSDLFSGFTSAVGTLKGPLHGGAAQEVIEMLDNKIRQPEDAERYVMKILETHGRVMGYGHRIYKTYDPRAKVLRKNAVLLSKMRGNMKYIEIADVLERTMREQKNLYPNVDFYSAIVYKHLGLPVELYSPIFAIARSFGWLAHMLEQYSDNRLIRPAENFIGKTGLKFIPIEKRQ